MEGGATFPTTTTWTETTRVDPYLGDGGDDNPVLASRFPHASLLSSIIEMETTVVLYAGRPFPLMESTGPDKCMTYSNLSK